MPEEPYLPGNLVTTKTESTLEDLQNTQSETHQLLSILKARLSVVSERTPEPEDKASVSAYTHIFQALDNQFAVNRTLRQLIDELKV